MLSKTVPNFSSLFKCAGWFALWAILTLLTHSAGATGPQVYDDPSLEKAKQALEVQWFRPEVIGTLSANQNKVIIFTGKTKPSARVQLRSEKVVRIEEDGSHRIQELNKSSLKNSPATVDRHGLFHFQMALSDGSYQLGVVVFDPTLGDHRAVRSYQLSFEVSEEGVELAGASRQEEAPNLILRPPHRLGLGLGSNLVIYRKKSGSIPMDANFSLVEHGSVFLDYLHSFLKGPWAMNYSLKLTPGAAHSTSEVSVARGDYLWWTLGAEALYYPEQWIVSTSKGRVYNIGARVGLQYHTQPFLRAFQASSNVQEVVENRLTALSGGLHADLRWSAKWSYEAFGRYQIPVLNSSESGVEVGSEFAFDGSVGAVYSWNPDIPWTLGAYWYGQWHQYKISEFDLFSQQNVTGKQTLFFSNLELRINYSF